MKAHYPGTDVVLEVTYFNLAGVAADPASQLWTVVDNGGSTVVTYTQADAQVTKISTGTWRLVYRIPDDARGIWTVWAAGTSIVVEKAKIQFSICR